MNSIEFTYEMNNGYWIEVTLNNDLKPTITKDNVPFIMPENERQDFEDVCKVLKTINGGIQ